MMKMRLPGSLRQFVARQTTIPVADLWDGDWKKERSPYGSYWYRAVAGILLSGRVQAKNDGAPNMTDVSRVGKEANFNRYLTERIGRFLVVADVTRFDRPHALLRVLPGTGADRVQGQVDPSRLRPAAPGRPDPGGPRTRAGVERRRGRRVGAAAR